MTNTRQDKASTLIENLTPRELEVLTMIGKGLTLPEIAEKLFRSQKTIETHRLSIGRKLGLSNRVELARVAIRAGLAPLHDDEDQDDPDNASLPGQASRPTEQIREELSHAHRPWQALRSIDQAVAGIAGAKFFRQLTRALQKWLEVKAAFSVAVRDELDQQIWPLGLCVDGQMRELPKVESLCGAFKYAFDHGIARFDGDAQTTPGPSGALEQAGVDHFLGLQLAYEGQPIGVLAIAHDQPLDKDLQVESILRILAPRASAEISRMIMEQRLLETRDHLDELVQQRTAQLAQANARLQLSERKWRTLIETMTDGVAVADANRVITYANPKLCEILDRPADEIVGKAVNDLITPECARWWLGLQDKREAGELPQYHLDWVRPDGTVVPTIVAPNSLFDENGRFVGSFGVMTVVESDPGSPLDD